MKTFAQVRNLLDEWFADPQVPRTEKTRLWNFLTGLRGPDSSSFIEKFATTEVIRYYGFPKGRGVLSEHMGIYLGRDTEEKVEHRFNAGDYHFREHARVAFLAIGLEWDYNNDRTLPPLTTDNAEARELQRNKPATLKPGYHL